MNDEEEAMVLKREARAGGRRRARRSASRRRGTCGMPHAFSSAPVGAGLRVCVPPVFCPSGASSFLARWPSPTPSPTDPVPRSQELS